MIPTAAQRMAFSELIKLENSAGIRNPGEWEKVASRVQGCLDSFRDWLKKSDAGIKTVAYGAAAKGVTLLSALKAEPGLIDFVIDNSPAKAAKYMPLVDAIIMNESEFVSTRPNGRYRYVIFPWNLTSEIIHRIRGFDPDAEVVTAVPALARVE